MDRWSGRRGSLYVIGDIHGCLTPLQRLLDKIAPGPDDQLVFIGDYIDRGPQSREVVEFLRALPGSTTFLIGNHEKMLLDYLGGRHRSLYLINGGEQTLRSYGEPPVIPEPHLAFVKTLRPYFDTPDFLIVHAGIRPMVPLDRQVLDDLVWIRHEFFQFLGRFEKPVVFGHTPMREVLMREDRIGIDTGCVYGGKLTCLRLPDRKVIQVRGLGRWLF
jgi:serine/threonine protein phosphatase 1